MGQARDVEDEVPSGMQGVGEDAVCWHSLSERLCCALQTSRLLEIDHSVVCSALKMKLTLKIKRYF